LKINYDYKKIKEKNDVISTIISNKMICTEVFN